MRKRDRRPAVLPDTMALPPPALASQPPGAAGGGVRAQQLWATAPAFQAPDHRRPPELLATPRTRAPCRPRRRLQLQRLVDANIGLAGPVSGELLACPLVRVPVFEDTRDCLTGGRTLSPKIRVKRSDGRHRSGDLTYSRSRVPTASSDSPGAVGPREGDRRPGEGRRRGGAGNRHLACLLGESRPQALRVSSS